ncbi:hypothetical protein FACS1894186_5940 [Alphaproteobacteria bacterium]|nr:hypothetical protein FACS1894186_5940 [Alphaproteobacteria bacterium]
MRIGIIKIHLESLLDQEVWFTPLSKYKIIVDEIMRNHEWRADVSLMMRDGVEVNKLYQELSQNGKIFSIKRFSGELKIKGAYCQKCKAGKED